MLWPIRRAVCLVLLSALPASAVLACAGSVHIEIEHAGVYALDQASIAAAAPGLAGCPRESLTLTQRGREVPIRISGSGATLQPGDRIEWIGKPLHGPLSWFDTYSSVNVYLLSGSPGPHARFADAPAVPGGAPASLTRRLHLEQENLMIRLNHNHVKQWEEADFWHWAKLTHVDPEPFSFDADLPDLAARGGTATFTLKFRGMSTAPQVPPGQTKTIDHSIVVQLGGKPVATFEWDGRNEVERQFTLPAAALQEKGNRFTLNVPKRPVKPNDPNFVVDVVMFNSIDIDYPADGDLARSTDAFRVAGGGKVSLQHGGGTVALYGDDGRRWTGTGGDFGRIDANAVVYPVVDDRFVAPQSVRAVAAGNWHTPAEPVDYLMISHARLIDAIQPLAEFHRRRGLKVAVIDVNDVYDQFNDGITHPQAIRNLMQQAYTKWPEPRPRFALLVGDASFDIRHQRINRRNLAKWADSELLAPGQFGDIDSTPYADTPADLKHRALIPTWQFMSYDGQSASDNHFVSVGSDPLHPVIALGRLPVVEPAEVKAIVDKTINYLSTPQLGGWRRDVMFITDESDYFKNTSDEISKSLEKDGFLSDKVYASKDEKDNLAHQSSIKDGLNDGRLLVHFIGHGGRYIWRTGPPDLRKNHDLFTLDDVSNLNNGGRLPMVLSMTCYSAPFDNPTEDSIGERFLREPGRGAIAVFAASWRNSPSAQYSKAIVSELIKPGRTIGESIVAGKQAVRDDTLVETYNLLGDPAVVLERPNGEFRFTRVARPFGPDAIEATIDRPAFRGKAEVSWLDRDGKRLHSTRFVVLGNRFTLPEPPAAVRAAAAEVRGYIADPVNPFDAIARLNLVPRTDAQPEEKPAEPKPAAVAVQPPEAAAALRTTSDAVNTGDVLLRSGFDVPVEATARGGESAAGAAKFSSK
ncbi:MAG TPA: C25 family cysteine peptidase [Tahibacter sp.]|uniref:C25 family cysteine peptidase n=1 Tax=Tahibacter sp. TaxID=2056211 RepID=UPI002BC1A708|nr:C25 family cysteine peptidase [Tahibacter sp.]HSX58704.1 C25 family cysteine peptidase [Tahibacter sp.]